MKLRIRGNSLRFRVTRGELQTLMNTGRLCEVTEFPQGRRFVYTLALSSEEAALHAAFTEGEMIVTLPRAQALRWQEHDQVGLSGVQNLADGKTLALLIEKDFPCLTPRPGEDESDAFPWPT